MTTDKPTQPLNASLSKHASLEAAVENLQKLSADSSERLASLESSCDLGDKGALVEITRLQALAALLPRRLTARQQALAENLNEILQSSHAFISTSLTPRIRDLLNRAEAQAMEAMKAHFDDQGALTTAVKKSAVVSELSNLLAGTSINGSPLGGPIPYARRLLDTWLRVNVLEQKFL